MDNKCTTCNKPMKNGKCSGCEESPSKCICADQSGKGGKGGKGGK